MITSFSLARLGYELIQPPNIYWTMVVIMAAFFLFGPLRRFFNGYSNALMAAKEKETIINEKAEGKEDREGETGEFGIDQDMELPRGAEAFGPSDDNVPERFGFINETNVTNLIHVVKDKELSEIAVIAENLSPDLASKFLSSLPESLQMEVAKEMVKVRYIDDETVNALEEEVKEKISSIKGGVEKYLAVFEQFNDKQQEEMLNKLSLSDPELCRQIREKTLRFRDIFTLDDQTLREILRKVERESLAVALNQESDEVREKVYGALPSGVAGILKQEVELSGSLPEQQIEEAKRKIVRQVRELEKEGWIKIEREVKTETEAESETKTEDDKEQNYGGQDFQESRPETNEEQTDEDV